jgi:subtilisin family serine protease
VRLILRESLRLYRLGQIPSPVFADLNYVTGYPEIAGNPWGIEGSPWGIEGSPWGIEGSPWGIEGSPLEGTDAEKLAVYQTVAERAFITQWPVTGPRGAGIYRPNYTRALPASADGTGTQVALFDTAPYTTSGEHLETRLQVRIPVCVHLLPQPRLNAPKDATGYMRDHGLFGAGLTWIAAPQSQLHLVRVLDDNAVGDMYTLVAGINGFTEWTLPRNSGLLRNVVYNFSLGIKPNAASVPAEIAQLNQEIIALMPPDERPQLVNGLPVTALEIPINTAYLFGAVLVASAGNDSAGLPQPAPANAPAAFRQVTGVFSTNLAMGQSCYSNDGDVGAPGGDGGVRPGDCQPLMDECKASSPCDYGVVSLVTAQADTVGYAYWVGTSFAAPLASGVAAAALEAGVPPFDMEQKLIDSALTRGVIDAVTTAKP